MNLGIRRHLRPHHLTRTVFFNRRLTSIRFICVFRSCHPCVSPPSRPKERSGCSDQGQDSQRHSDTYAYFCSLAETATAPASFCGRRGGCCRLCTCTCIRSGTRGGCIDSTLAPSNGLGVVVDGDVEVFAQSKRRSLPDVCFAGELKVAAERLGRVAERKYLTEPEKLTTRCRSRFVDRYQFYVRTWLSGRERKWVPIIRSPRFGDEEFGLRTPHQRWSHGVEKSDVQEALIVSR